MAIGTVLSGDTEYVYGAVSSDAQVVNGYQEVDTEGQFVAGLPA